MFGKPKSVSNYTWGVGQSHSKFSVVGVSWRQNIPGMALFKHPLGKTLLLDLVVGLVIMAVFAKSSGTVVTQALRQLR